MWERCGMPMRQERVAERGAVFEAFSKVFPSP